MTRADDCEVILRILADAPAGGLSQDELAEKSGMKNWSVNDTLVALAGQVASQRGRTKSGKHASKYTLKGGR